MDIDTCESFRNPSPWNLTVSIGLTVGIVMSYVPQHYRVIKRRNSEGISPWFLLLGIVSGVCAVCNIWLLSRPIFHCCSIVSKGECFASTLGIAQITLQAVSATLILVLVLIFAKPGPLESPHQFYKMQLVGKYSFVSVLVAIVVSLVAFFKQPSYTLVTANCFGVFGAVLAMVQYVPQIYTTATLQHAGTLSIPMMCIQTPGGFMWSLSLAQRPGTTWSSWLPYLTAASLQAILLIMAVYFERRDKKRAARLQRFDERQALLS